MKQHLNDTEYYMFKVEMFYYRLIKVSRTWLIKIFKNNKCKNSCERLGLV